MTGMTGYARQRGAVIILFFLAIFLSGATVVLSALNNRSSNIARGVETQVAMERAKEALLAYALMYSKEYAGSGPGRLPCVDSNNDGLADCTAAQLGRLPEEVVLPSGVRFTLSDAGAGIDEQLWYALTPAFRTDAVSLNSTTAGTLTLDAEAGIVAVLIAPGIALTGQARPDVLASAYLEDVNSAGTTFVSSSALANFNDRVIPIRRAELMSMVVPRVAQEIKVLLDNYRPANGNTYPVDLPAFLTAMTPGWIVTNNWHTSVETYTLTTPPNIASFKFLNCAVTFTINFAADTIVRSQASC
jgi:hypothetical protein